MKFLIIVLFECWEKFELVVIRGRVQVRKKLLFHLIICGKIFCFPLKKTAVEAHRILSSTYGKAALSERTCCEWFQRFKSDYFDIEDRHGGGKEKIFEDFEWEALLAEDSYQTQGQLAESLEVTQQAISKRFKAIRMI